MWLGLFYDQCPSQSRMERAADDTAHKTEFPLALRGEFNGLHFAWLNNARVNTQLSDDESVGDVFADQAQANRLSLLDDDAAWGVATVFHGANNQVDGVGWLADIFGQGYADGDADNHQGYGRCCQNLSVRFMEFPLFLRGMVRKSYGSALNLYGMANGAQLYVENLHVF